MRNKFTGKGSKSFTTFFMLASILLNLFMVGALMGGMGGKHKHFGLLSLNHQHGEYLVEGMARSLDQNDAAALRDIAQAQQANLIEAHHQVREATKNAAFVFEQDPPDVAALTASLQRLSEAKAQADAAVQKIMQDAYTKLSPEGRRRLAEMTR